MPKLPLIFLALLALLVFLPNLPLNNVPERDSGVFLYVGGQILDGRIPYRDVWDHKGPLLYYLNAFGLAVGNGSVMGVWVVELLLVGTAVVLSFWVLSAVFGAIPAGFSTIVWLLNAYLLQIGGNLTEAYALPFQFAALYFFWQSFKSPYKFRCGAAIGLTAGAAFLLRPNNIGIHLAIAVYFGVAGVRTREWPWLIQRVVGMLAGFSVVVGGTAVYFATHHALNNLINQMFIYNFTYAEAASETRLVASLAILFAFMSFGLVVMILSAWVIGWYQIGRKKLLTEAWGPLVLVALIALPIEVVFASASGLTFAHYALSLLPTVAILVAFLAHGLFVNFVPYSKWAAYGVLLGLLIWTIYKPASQIVSDLITSEADNNKAALLADMREAVTGSNTLLFWGAETSYNFVLDVPAPTRFVYQYPLYTAAYTTPAMIHEFLAGIVRERPLLIDTSSTNPNVPPLDEAGRASWQAVRIHRRMAHLDSSLTYLQPVFAYIAAHYTLVGTVGHEEWPVYVYTNRD